MVQYSTIPQMFLQSGATFFADGHPVYMSKKDGTYSGISYPEFRELVECFSSGLVKLGIEPGDRVGIVSENRLEWVISDFAITGCGAADVPVFPTLTARQLEYTYNNCSAAIIIVSNKMQLAKILSVRAELPALEHIIIMNDEGTNPSENIHSFSDVIQLGRDAMPAKERTEQFERLASAVKPDDLCTIIYTSGTTGNPKGVMLTHRNLCSNINAVNDVVHVGTDDIFLSYLPMCHSYERIGGFYIAFGHGATTAFAESLESVRTNLQEVRPTIMTSVPRLFERIRNGVIANVEKQPPGKQKIFNLAVSVGKRMVNEQQMGSVSAMTKVMYAAADAMVFSKIRSLTGGRLRFFVSGGGALAYDVKEFFTMVGMVILEGYGLTETSPVLTVTRPDDNEIGTVGKPILNVEIKLADDGEILARGPNIMRGYWHNQEATHETIDSDGWLHTGDIGAYTKRGNLKITDRKKNLFVSSGGKNIAPQVVENVLLQSKYIDQVLLLGDNKEYCSALIVPDYELIKPLLSPTQSITSVDDLNSPAVVQAISGDINRVQRDLAKYERVRRIYVLPEAFTVENGMMTPTLKIKRAVVEHQYKAEIESLYESTAKEGF
jgi:long-chain acyl-CoA synthetase